MQHKHNTLQVFYIFVALLLSLIMAFATACDDSNKNDDTTPDDETTEEVEEEKIPLPILNGYFTDMYSSSTSSFPVDPKNWSLAADTIGSASSSSSDVTQHGIVSVDNDDFYANSDNFQTEKMQEAGVQFSDTAESVLKNPSTPFMTVEGNEETDKYVLMLMNQYVAAGKYVSSSISFAQNQYARIIVYVNAFSVDENGKAAFAYGQGASIALNGGDAPIVLRNIDTSAYATSKEEIAFWTGRDAADVTDEEAATLQGWKRYEFLVEGSALSSSSLTLELGLGKGAESDTTGYTEGFAFFDQITMEYITQKEYYAAIEAGNAVTYRTQSVQEIVDQVQPKSEHSYNFATADDKSATVFAYSFRDVTTALLPQLSINDTTTFKPTGSTQLNAYFENIEVGTVKASDAIFFNNASTDSIFCRELEKTVEDEEGNETTEKVNVWANDNFPFASDDIYYILSKNGPTAGGIKIAENIVVEAYKYYRISVWVKTSEPKTGAINLHLINNSKDIPDNNAAKMYSFTGIVTDTISLNDRETQVSRHDKYADWVEYSFYISGSQFEGSTFDLELWMGNRVVAPTDDKTSLVNENNFVLATNLVQEEITSEKYSSASGTNAKTGIVASLTSSPSITNGNFDDSVASQTTRYDDVNTPSGWTELYGKTAEGTYAPNTSADYVAGIVNRNHAAVDGGAADYEGKAFYAAFKQAINPLNANLNTALDAFYNIDGTSSGNTNVMMIYNVNATAIGYRAGSGSVAANTFVEVRVWVRTENTNGNAYIYLTSDGEVIVPEGLIATYDENDDEVVTSVTEHKGEALQIAIPASAAGSWNCYKFYIAAGAEAVSYNLELWLGSMDASELTSGMMFFDMASGTTVTEAVYDAAKEATDENAVFGDYSEYYVEPGTSSDTEDEEEEEEEEAENNASCGSIGWEGITTIALMVAIIVALVAVLARKISSSKKFQKKQELSERSYDRNNEEE